ncbi:integrase, partial [Acinetobacter seifertii]|nr:integrase [Acinetobacter seifertii]
ARVLARQKLKDLSDTSLACIKNDEILKNNLNKEYYQPTLAESFQAYIDHHKLKERTLADYKEVIEKYLIDLKELKLIYITEQMVIDKYTQLSKSSYAKANLSMRVLRAIYHFSVKYYKNTQTTIPIMNPIALLNSREVWREIPVRNDYIDID